MKRVDMLPGFPVLWVVTFAAGVLMIVTGGFNTGTLPLGQRIGFWALLLGWKSLLWQAWFALMVRRHRDWTRAVLIGVVVLNLPLPLEIAGVLTILGIAPALDPVQVWRAALLISLAIFPAMWLIVRRVRGKDAAPPVVPDDGLLHRARTAPEALCAIEAEDHYCRVRRRDGGDALIHYRFGDALGEVAGIQGIQVHRGAWVAADAVLGAVREGRRWMLLLADGSKVPVSATHLPQVRARGWLVAPDQRTLASARLRG
ncbi:MAG: LytTR family DNA-binding domain-containing protein [Sphingomonas sp.]